MSEYVCMYIAACVSLLHLLLERFFLFVCVVSTALRCAAVRCAATLFRFVNQRRDDTSADQTTYHIHTQTTVNIRMNKRKGRWYVGVPFCCGGCVVSVDRPGDEDKEEKEKRKEKKKRDTIPYHTTPATKEGERKVKYRPRPSPHSNRIHPTRFDSNFPWCDTKSNSN